MQINATKTTDKIDAATKELAKQKQVGNTRSLLLESLPWAREIRAGIWSSLWLLETTADALFRTLSLVARPQDIRNTWKIIRNGIKATIAEKPQIETKWVGEYVQNLRAPKLTRDGMKQYHDPYKDETKFFDTHDSRNSLAPNKSDHRFKKTIKWLPWIAGKAIKIPAWTASLWAGVLADTFRRAKGQKLKDLVTLKFNKTDWNKTKLAWNKLFSRNYQKAEWTKPNENTITNEKKSDKPSFRSRIWPFGKNKKEKNNTVETTQIETKKEQTSQNNTANLFLGSLASGVVTAQALEQAWKDKDQEALEKHTNKLINDSELWQKEIQWKDLPEPEKKNWEIITTTLKKLTEWQYDLPQEQAKKEWEKIVEDNTIDKEEKTKEQKKIDKEQSQKESNEAMKEYIEQEQKRLTTMYNKKEPIEEKESKKWIKLIQWYQKANGKVVFTKLWWTWAVLSGNLQSIQIDENNNVEVEFITDDNTIYKESIPLTDIFDSTWSSFHMK